MLVSFTPGDHMREPLPTLFIPGLSCSARLYSAQIAALWRCGSVTVTDHTRDESMRAIAGRILRLAPPRFALVGLSMGGYIAFEVFRQAPERIARLALFDTSARPDRPDQTAVREQRIALARAGRFAEIADQMFPLLVHPSRHADADLRQVVRQMDEDTGAEAYVRQQTAIMGRPDSRPDLAAIRCPTLVLVGDGDALTPPDLAREMADAIAGARLMVVPDCGHLSTLERPEAVSQALLTWMEADAA
jgi:pimeloyl-ACP methyl ester carboxylesterase